MAKVASEKQKNDALKLGLAAHEEGLSCIPAHDKKLMTMIKELSGQIGASKPLLESWIKGWHKAHSLPYRAAAQVNTKGYLDQIMGSYALAGDLLQLNKHPNYKYKSEEFQKSDDDLVAKLQKMLHKEHLSGCHDDASCDINFAAENDFWHWAIEQFIGSGAASSGFKNLYKKLSPEFKKEAEKERKMMAEMPHKTCRHCHSVNWGEDVKECGQCLNKISATFNRVTAGAKTIVQDVVNLSSGTLSTLLSKEGVETRDTRTLDKVHQMFIKMVVGALDSDPNAYKDWKDAWKYFKESYDLKTLEIKQGKNISTSYTLATTTPLDAEDAAASLLNRYFAKRSKALAETASKYCVSAVTDSDIQKMSSQTLLEKIRSGELTYTQVDVALEKIKKFSTLDWIGDKLAEDELKNNTYLYVIDKDERGEFSCHVEDPDGKDVWSASNEESEDGEFYPVSDGFMKHNKDIKGLEKYLKELELLPKEAVLNNG